MARRRRRSRGQTRLDRWFGQAGLDRWLGVSGEADVVRRVERLVEEYSRRLGVKVRPRVAASRRDWKATMARLEVRPSGGRPVLRVHARRFVEYFKIDPVAAEKVLRYTVAHEVGHLAQYERYGRGMGRRLRLSLESEADEVAGRLTGMSRYGFEVLQERLERALHQRFFGHWKR